MVRDVGGLQGDRPAQGEASARRRRFKVGTKSSTYHIDFPHQRVDMWDCPAFDFDALCGVLRASSPSCLVPCAKKKGDAWNANGDQDHRAGNSHLVSPSSSSSHLLIWRRSSARRSLLPPGRSLPRFRAAARTRRRGNPDRSSRGQSAQASCEPASVTVPRSKIS